MTHGRVNSNDSMKKPRIYLADLTHTGQLIASNTFPLGIAFVAAAFLKRFPETFELSLYKYPDHFSRALEEEIPTVVGFANYAWNMRLSIELAKRIKKAAPQTIIVFGGPNYPSTRLEQEEFVKALPEIDFFIYKEGEAAFVELIEKLAAKDFDAEKLKATGEEIGNVHYVWNGRFIAGPLLPRVNDLDDVPSPYINGLLDQFFDGTLIPMLQTNRGCPFQCTFCTEGQEYFNKVKFKGNESVLSDLRYIAERVGTVPDLVIVDSNFGMFQQDLETCREIARLQEKYQWPKHVHVSTGKNQKARVIEAARTVHGALNLSATLQSSDPEVLRNVKRSNISVDQVMQIAQEADSIQANSYCELILALPGDTKEKHIQSLRDVVEAGLSFIRMYQLMMLPGTDMNNRETRSKFGMKTGYRIMPRCFGKYSLFKEEFAVAEIEEICIGSKTMPFEDYLDCREFDLTIETLHNSDLFREIYELVRHFGFSWFDFVERIHTKRHEVNPRFSELYQDFRSDTAGQLRSNAKELEDEIASPGRIDEYISGREGNNVIFKFKAIAFFNLHSVLLQIMCAELKLLFQESGLLDSVLCAYIEDLEVFLKMRKSNLIDTTQNPSHAFRFHFKKIMEHHFKVDPRNFYSPHVPERLLFSHDDWQREAIKGYVKQYGTTNVGLGRILLRAHVKKLYRSVSLLSQPSFRSPAPSLWQYLNLQSD